MFAVSEGGLFFGEWDGLPHIFPLFRHPRRRAPPPVLFLWGGRSRHQYTPMISPTHTHSKKHKTSLAGPDDVAALQAALFSAADGGAAVGVGAPDDDVVVSPRTGAVASASRKGRADG